MANMMLLIGFGYASEPEREAALGSGLHDLAELLIEWLVVGKFYSLFSMLFGIGFAVQLARLEQRGEGPSVTCGDWRYCSCSAWPICSCCGWATSLLSTP